MPFTPRQGPTPVWWISTGLCPGSKSSCGVAEIGSSELTFLLLSEVMTGHIAAVGEAVFAEADPDEFGFDARDFETHRPWPRLSFFLDLHLGRLPRPLPWVVL